jgi:hypothetical protein
MPSGAHRKRPAAEAEQRSFAMLDQMKIAAYLIQTASGKLGAVQLPSNASVVCPRECEPDPSQTPVTGGR